ncbi:MAG: class II aldolase/adducin family protein, partial [Planctomycetota bacterium]
MKEFVCPQVCHDVATTMGRVYRRGLTTITGGNISVRDDTDQVRITPAGVDKSCLRPQDVVCVHPDGSFSGGQPSSELPVHRHAYRRRPDVGALIHAHSPALVAFSIRHEVPDTAILPEAFAACGAAGYLP